jgi:flagella basal body P-ring formation protein FlgA
MTKKLIFLTLIAVIVFITGVNAYPQDQTFIEAKISDFIRKIYNEEDDLQIKFGRIAAPLRGRPSIKNMSFAKVPDAKGDGVCLVEIVDGKSNRDRGVYVPFRAIRKTKVFILTSSGKKGDVLRAESIAAKETHFNEKKTGYPSKLDDIVGRTLKKDVATGTVVAYSMIEDPVVIQKGEVINIVAENKKLLVQTKGKAMEKGRMGDSIRVKNILSEKEIFGKVVDDNTVSVKF